MRRAAALGAALAAALWAAPAGATPEPAGASWARAGRAAVLVQAAELTDRLEGAQADVVAAQLRQDRARDVLARLRSRVRARAVDAYVGGTAASVAAATAPRVYREVAAAKERALVTRLRSATADAVAERQRADSVLDQVARATDELHLVRAGLEATIAVDDARRAEAARQADQARHAALARQAAALATARANSRAGLAQGPPGYAPSPLDPAALLPRHKQATQRQLSLMTSIPFGPLAPGAPLPAGLAATGRVATGEASWYGPGFNGRATASGAIYDQEGWTVASKDLPLGTFLVVARGDRRVLLLVNDRGPYVDGRVLDQSAAAARALGIGGVAPVVAEVVTAR